MKPNLSIRVVQGGGEGIHGGSRLGTQLAQSQGSVSTFLNHRTLFPGKLKRFDERVQMRASLLSEGINGGKKAAAKEQ